jgi:type II secretory pathway component GspD/PulD (secretin)
MVAMLVLGARATLAQEKDPLEVRRFSVTAMEARMAESELPTPKEFLTAFGIAWPEGSSAQFVGSTTTLVVRNTRRNLDEVRTALAVANVLPFVVDIQLDFIEFSMDDVEKLNREQRLSGPALLALWRQGQGKLVHSPHIVTKNGSEGTVKGVVEYIYPTEFSLQRPANTNAGLPQTSLDGVEPGGFETREVGVILQVVPDVAPDGQLINVCLAPQVVEPPEWKDYGDTPRGADGTAVKRPMPQPFFPVSSISTSVSVADGATTLIGGGMTRPGGDKAVYAFLTVRRLDTEGNPIAATGAAK